MPAKGGSNIDGAKSNKKAPLQSTESMLPKMSIAQRVGFRISMILFGAFTIAVFMLVQRHVPDAYMDEIFHIPQTQKYCENKFSEWDSKITTLPGLYLFALVHVKNLNTLLSLVNPASLFGTQMKEDLCYSPAALRSTNIIFLLACYYLFFKILWWQSHQSCGNKNLQQQSSREEEADEEEKIKRGGYAHDSEAQPSADSALRKRKAASLPASNIRSNNQEENAQGHTTTTTTTTRSSAPSTTCTVETRNYIWSLVKTIRLSLFPLHFFFVTMFYTDLGSTFFVLCVYYLSIVRRRHFFSGVVGFIAVLFRQTNVIWVFFVTCLLLVEKFEEHETKASKNPATARENHDDDTAIFSPFTHLISQLWQCTIFTLVNLPSFIASFLYPYLIIGIGFVVFVWYNGGIVVGDRENHTVTIHLAQLLYFFTFFAIMSPAETISVLSNSPLVSNKVSTAPRKKASSSRRLLKLGVYFALFSVLAFLVVNKFSYTHKFLLSDNRHYTFYIWKNVFRRFELAKYCLIPVYFIGCSVLVSLLRASGKSALWITVYLLCVALVIVPLPLVEFRYYILPFLLAHLNITNSTRPATTSDGSALIRGLFNTAVYLVINAATLYVFVFKPFKNSFALEPSPEMLSRFMW